MKKLEEIPKNSVFKVPEDYFDSLPGVIQARISEKSSQKMSPYFSFSVRYALPAFVMILALVLWFNRPLPGNNQTAEEILASIDTESLVAYLENTELTTEDILETVDLSQLDIIEIENEVYDFNLDDEEIDDLLNVYDDELNDL